MYYATIKSHFLQIEIVNIANDSLIGVKEMKAKLVCAWCGKILGVIETSDGHDSHGICEKCYQEAIKELKTTNNLNLLSEAKSHAIPRSRYL